MELTFILTITVLLGIIAADLSTCIDRTMLFARTPIDECLAEVGVSIPAGPVSEHLNTISDCALSCDQDTMCSRVLFCPGRDESCSRIQTLGVFDSLENRRHCTCSRKVIACENGGNVANDTCQCPIGFFGNTCERVIKDCPEGYSRGLTGTTIAFVQPIPNIKPFPVLCEFDQVGKTVIQNRPENVSQRVDFYRNWHDYKHGFGDLMGEFWTGLIQLHAMTYGPGGNPLRHLEIGIYAGGGTLYHVHYNRFLVWFESSGYMAQFYQFEVDPDAPNSGDSLTPSDGSLHSNGRCFATYDHNNCGTNTSCTASMRSGWWFGFGPQCTAGNLNGPYLSAEEYEGDSTQPKITWLHNAGDVWIKETFMKIY